jgi:single-stranded DNA-binding protein
MHNINQIIVEGNVSCNPTLRYTLAGNKPVTNFYLYVDSKYKTKNFLDGKPVYNKNTSKIPVVAWAGKAEFITNTFSKGDKVRVLGYLKTKETTCGEKTVLTFEVIAKDIYLITRAQDNA